jgi:hypothetical protein
METYSMDSALGVSMKCLLDPVPELSSCTIGLISKVGLSYNLVPDITIQTLIQATWPLYPEITLVQGWMTG